MYSIKVHLDDLDEAFEQAVELGEISPNWRHMTARAKHHRSEALSAREPMARQAYLEMSWLALECALEMPGARQEYLRKLSTLAPHDSWLNFTSLA